MIQTGSTSMTPIRRTMWGWSRFFIKPATDRAIHLRSIKYYIFIIDIWYSKEMKVNWQGEKRKTTSILCQNNRDSWSNSERPLSSTEHFSLFYVFLVVFWQICFFSFTALSFSRSTQLFLWNWVRSAICYMASTTRRNDNISVCLASLGKENETLSC